jgi:AcrR family transcriptional regulator
MTPEDIAHLPTADRAQTAAAFADAITMVFRYAVPVLVVGFLLTWLFEERPLRTASVATRRDNGDATAVSLDDSLPEATPAAFGGPAVVLGSGGSPTAGATAARGPVPEPACTQPGGRDERRVRGMSGGLRERKKAETRRALSSAALRLAQELGPDGVTVEAIAEASGVSTRTFFNYFSSKDDAIVGIAPSEPSELLSDLVARPADEAPLDALRGMALAAAERLEATADELWARHQLAQRYPSLAVRRSARMAEVERGLAEEIARRTGLDVDRDAFPALVVTAALGAVRVGMAVWHGGGRAKPLTLVIGDTFDQIQSGFDLAAVGRAAAR